MKSVLTLLAVAAVGLPVTHLSAEDEGPRKQKDGHAMKALTLEDITSSERHQRAVEAGVAVDVAAIFAEADANADGTLTKEEMPAFHKAMQSAHRTNMFARIDSDGSGELSTDEMKAFREAMKERRQARQDERGDEGKGHKKPQRGEGEQAEDRAERPSPAERFAEADADGSGGLSLDEFLAMEHQHRGPKGKKGEGHKKGHGKGHGKGEGKGKGGDKVQPGDS